MDSKMDSLVSAVIPTRNRPALVCRAIRSALAQTYSNLEVVVVIDGPDPVTAETLESLAEPRLRVIALSENAGGSEARNIGARAARGSWVAFLDDDDEWMLDKIEKQMASRPKDPTPYCLITSRGVRRNPGEPDVIAPRRLPRLGEDVSEYMFYSDDGQRHTCGPQTSGYLATKDLFLAVPFEPGLKCHQDWDWYLRAIRDHRTVATMLEEPLYILYVESTRPRVSTVASWKRSLDWVELRKDLFSERAYISFLINECMYRCEDSAHRTRIFLQLLGRCRRVGALRFSDLLAALKWFLFPPSLRLRLTQRKRQSQPQASVLHA